MAGDMFLAALCDLDQEALRPADLEELARGLVPEGCSLTFERTRRGSIAATGLDVRTPEGAPGAHPPHRHLADLVELLARAPLGATARVRAERVLRRIAEAEARVHGTRVEEVHFHEVGAVDTLVDVAGACWGLERLGVGRVLATPPYVGAGSVRCAHGEMPVPAPGTAEILRDLPFLAGPGGERLTPTGAALLAELVDKFSPTGPLRSLAIGYGAGRRDPAEGPPNLLRVSLVEELVEPGPSGRREAWQVDCNLDDATGEELGFLVGLLREAGALEAWTAPVQMKKDRPGVIVSALCRAEQRTALETVLFEHSPTLGVRWSRVERRECEREELVLEHRGGRVRVKLRRPAGTAPGRGTAGALDVSPEHDDLAALARASGRSLRELEREVVALALARLRAPATPADSSRSPR